jgi:hypothetical protein
MLWVGGGQGAGKTTLRSGLRLAWPRAATFAGSADTRTGQPSARAGCGRGMPGSP